MPQESRAEAVPRLYKVAATVFKDFNAGKDSIKNLTYQARKKHPNIKAIFALVMEAVNHAQAITQATEKIELFEKEPRFQKDLAFVLITELLFGKKTLPGTSLPITTLQRYEKQLLNNMHGAENKSGREKSLFPKYARVNSLCNSLHRVARQLREEGWFELMYDKQSTTYSQYLEMVGKLEDKTYLMDYHLDNLMVFPAGTQLYDNPLVLDGSLLLQDKASCLPVHALAPPPGSVVLDACSAPGMKTSQISGLVCGDWVAAMGGDPPRGAKVIAVERSMKRCTILRQIMNRSRASSVATVLNQDFLEIEPNSINFSDVEYIVLDPSCSGTGMIKRNSVEEAPPTEERLQSLASIQKKLLTHALNFPHVKRLVYSTCATSRMENEDVIQEVLKDRKDWATCNILPSWERRGEGEGGEHFLRADPHLDLCNGFFVAVIERTKEPLQSVTIERCERRERPEKKNYKEYSESPFSGLNSADEGHETQNFEPKSKKPKYKEYSESPFSSLNTEKMKESYAPANEASGKKKKKMYKEYSESPFSSLNEERMEETHVPVIETSGKKKKKMYKEYSESPFSNLNTEKEENNFAPVTESSGKKKKKMYKEYSESPFSDLSKTEQVEENIPSELSEKKKKKKFKEYSESPFSELNEEKKAKLVDSSPPSEPKRKKKKKNQEEPVSISEPNIASLSEPNVAKKKKKKKDKKEEVD